MTTASRDTELLVRCHDRAAGLTAVVAVDDTTLGPGLGGVRRLPYADEDVMVEEACRLARVMTLKHACADLPYGGAKSVLLRPEPDDVQVRDVQLRAFGRCVERLGGSYIPGVDMGTTVRDLAVVGEVTRHVACDDEDPSPWTALGVFVGIAATLPAIGVGLQGAHVVLQGAGHVGTELARRLAKAGCRLSVADVDPVRARALAQEIGGELLDPDTAVMTRCDVLAPCATAKVIDRTNAEGLRCAMVAGGANDVLATPEVAAVLEERRVVYVPDFVINAGGVIHIHALRDGWGARKLEESVLAIGDRVAGLIAEAARSGCTPLQVAEQLASERLGRPIALLS